MLFRSVQDSADRVRFLWAAEHISDADRALLQRRVGDALGPAVKVRFERVADIPLTAAGKLRVVVNNAPGARAA